MQSGTNKTEHKHCSIWYGWYSYMEDYSDTEVRRKKIRQQQKTECKNELSDYIDGKYIKNLYT